jgi:hypothetical protein
MVVIGMRFGHEGNIEDETNGYVVFKLNNPRITYGKYG